MFKLTRRKGRADDKHVFVSLSYTKKTLRDLHPNIHVQRSPSHFATGTFYWSHHEKMCVIDEVTAFMGGVDLCFGRWVRRFFCPRSGVNR